MADDLTTVFPSSVMALVAARLGQICENTVIQTKPISSMNAGKTIAILPISWGPFGDEEIGTFPRDANPIQEYGLQIQVLVSGMDSAATINSLSLLSRQVRHTLMRDELLHSTLAVLRCEESGIVERFMSLTVRSQRFLGSGDKQTVNYLSSTDVAVKTEIIG